MASFIGAMLISIISNGLCVSEAVLCGGKNKRTGGFMASLTFFFYCATSLAFTLARSFTKRLQLVRKQLKRLHEFDQDESLLN